MFFNDALSVSTQYNLVTGVDTSQRLFSTDSTIFSLFSMITEFLICCFWTCLQPWTQDIMTFFCLASNGYFGICSTALNRFRPYLSCRKQYFLIDDQKSPETSLDLSVPQGSVLGPVPFSLYATRLTGLVENIVFVTMTIYSSVTLDRGKFTRTWSIHFHIHKIVLKISGYGWKKANSN